MYSFYWGVQRNKVTFSVTELICRSSPPAQVLWQSPQRWSMSLACSVPGSEPYWCHGSWRSPEDVSSAFSIRSWGARRVWTITKDTFIKNSILCIILYHFKISEFFWKDNFLVKYIRYFSQWPHALD